MKTQRRNIRQKKPYVAVALQLALRHPNRFAEIIAVEVADYSLGLTSTGGSTLPPTRPRSARAGCAT